MQKFFGRWNFQISTPWNHNYHPSGFIRSLSPWLGKLYMKYTGKYKRRVALKKILLVKKYKSSDGRTRVSAAYSEISTYILNKQCVATHESEKEKCGLRCGSKALRGSQVYPKRYGQKVCKYHLKHAATCLEFRGSFRNLNRWTRTLE